MKAAKALFEVNAGVVPGVGIAEFHKRWGYDSDEYEQDRHVAPDQPTIFSQRMQEVHNYAMGLSNPAYVNWVRVDWIWV
ncbi:MAG TPA: hypothetical protein VGG62_12235 [Terracidiphilus sp.]|jgi:hypothetical protein